MIPRENSRINLPLFFVSSSPEDTFALGKRLAALLKRGGIIALRGPLGAGKTCFIKGIAEGLGVEEEITSPTYTIVSEYECFPDTGPSVPLYHIDAYRIKGNEDFTAIGGEDILFGNGISVIEWSENIPGFIPPEALRVDIELKEGEKRLIHIYQAENAE